MTALSFAAKRQGISRRVRFAVFRRDGFACVYCGRRPPEVVLEPDHLTPVTAGGTNDPANLVTSCRDCNRGKGDMVANADGEMVSVSQARHAPGGKRQQLIRVPTVSGWEFKHPAFVTAHEYYCILADLTHQRAKLDLRIDYIRRLAEWAARCENSSDGGAA